MDYSPTNTTLVVTLREQIASLEAELRAAREKIAESQTKYSELVDALCSAAWLGINRHESVVGLAKRLAKSQTILRPLELEGIALAAGYCIRERGHIGPCNGLPRNDCFTSQEPHK